MTKDTALRLALEALEDMVNDCICRNCINQVETITAIKAALEAKDEPWEKFCDSNCVWTDHHPDCKLAKDAPVALEVYRGEICYQSTDDDQSFGMWCPVNYDSKHGFADGTKFYTTPPQRKPLTVEEIAKLDCYDHLKFARAIEAAHGIKE